jgi:hypothetical protein
VTAFAPQAEKFRELDEGMRRAWSEYSQRLRELTGEDYERAEHESWAELQTALAKLERRRRSLERAST